MQHEEICLQSLHRNGGIHFPNLDPCLVTLLKIYLVKNKYVALPGMPSLIGKKLDAALGHWNYTATYVTSNIQAWCDEVKHLAYHISRSVKQ